MNRKDREFVDRLDIVVRTIGTLTPQNPADVAAVAGNLRIATLASKALTRAITSVRSGDYQAASDHLTEAIKIAAPQHHTPHSAIPGREPSCLACRAAAG